MSPVSGDAQRPSWRNDGHQPVPKIVRLLSGFPKEPDMSTASVSVAKVIEICSASPRSLEDAIVRGVERATRTIEKIQGVWVQDIKCEVENGKVTSWRVNLKLTFVLNQDH
jgi:hypothetical protein